MNTTHTPIEIDKDTFTYRGLTVRKATRMTRGNSTKPIWAVYYSNGFKFATADKKPEMMQAIDAVVDDYDAFKKPEPTFTGWTFKYIKDGVVHVDEVIGKTEPDTSGY